MPLHDEGLPATRSTLVDISLRHAYTRPQQKNLVFFRQHHLAVQQALVPQEAEPYQPGYCHKRGRPHNRVNVHHYHQRTTASIGASRRLPIFHAASIAASVGTNPSATQPTSSNISITAIYTAGQKINSAQMHGIVIACAPEKSERAANISCGFDYSNPLMMAGTCGSPCF